MAEKLQREMTKRRREVAEQTPAAASASHELRETPIELDPESLEETVREVGVASSQRQLAKKGAEVSCRRGSRNTNRSTNGDRCWGQRGALPNKVGEHAPDAELPRKPL